MKIKFMKIKKYSQQKFSRKVVVPQTTADLTSRVMHFCANFSQALQFKNTFLCF